MGEGIGCLLTVVMMSVREECKCGASVSTLDGSGSAVVAAAAVVVVVLVVVIIKRAENIFGTENLTLDILCL